MPRDGAVTRTAILDAAQALILEHGFSATAIDAVIARTGITKGAFFYHFKSKADLGEALVRRYAELDAAHLETIGERAKKLSNDPLQQLLICIALFEEEAAVINSAPYPGCIYASYCYEAQLFNERTMEIVREAFAMWRRRIGNRLRAIAEVYPPRVPVDIDSLADMLLGIAEGAFILGRINRDTGAATAQFRHYRAYIELLFAPNLAALQSGGHPASVKADPLDVAAPAA